MRAMAVALTAGEEVSLSRRWRQRGDRRALEQLVQSQLALVPMVVRRYHRAGTAYEDLVQEGYLGLTVAAQRFDPQRGARLATYAAYWIRAQVLGYVARMQGPIRVGTTRAARRLFLRLGSARRRINGPDDRAMLAKEVGIELRDLEELWPRLVDRRDRSLDDPGANGSGAALAGRLASDEPSPEDAAIESERRRFGTAAMRRALANLDPCERAIVRSRYLAAVPNTLEKIGHRFGLSRERIRQIELRALEKLRAECNPNTNRRNP